VNFESLPQGVRLAVQAAQEKKAAGIIVLDLASASAFTDYFVICTGFSTPQVQAICTEIEEQLEKQMGRSVRHREGYRSADWALLDFGGFIVHVFSEEALPGLLNAGIDCIEHGTGITEDVIDLMVEHRTALVPTLINLDNFPGIADAAAKYPTYAAHMRDLYATGRRRVAAAREAGVPIYAGTDAGSMVAHGRIADEVDALKGVGMTATDALGAACWHARLWLGRPALEHGAPADMICFSDDPRTGAVVLKRPDVVILRGAVFS